uniref:hypothetical protein n=1 Tax=Klebsiella sp. TaxID=576 RepID=UPI00258FC65F|nr:hypothetical protein [Klebsiella sp.]
MTGSQANSEKALAGETDKGVVKGVAMFCYSLAGAICAVGILFLWCVINKELWVLVISLLHSFWIFPVSIICGVSIPWSPLRTNGGWFFLTALAAALFAYIMVLWLGS